MSTSPDKQLAFGLQAVMRQGTASSVAALSEHYATLDEARAAGRAIYRDDRVLRVEIVTNEVPPRFVEWLER